jgi:hypothetical protein
MTTKVKELETEHADRMQRIKDLKARVVTQIKELDFTNIEHTQKIKMALSAGDTF